MKREDERAVVKDAAVFVREDSITVRELEIEKAEEFKRLSLQMKVMDVWQHVNSDGSLNLDKLCEEIKKLRPTSIMAGWCFSKTAELFLERFGVTADLVLQDDLMKVLGKK